MELIRPASKQPMPESAKLVFKGILFDVYQWDQVGFDGKVKVFEKLKRPDTVVVLPITEDGKILYSYQEQPRKKPFISSFGGRVDEGEDVLAAARRELLEESGYGATEWILFEAVQPSSKIDWCVWIFIAKGCKPAAEQHLDGGERIEVRSATLEEFFDIVLHDDFADDRLKIHFLEARLDPEKMKEIEEMFRKL